MLENVCESRAEECMNVDITFPTSSIHMRCCEKVKRKSYKAHAIRMKRGEVNGNFSIREYEAR